MVANLLDTPWKAILEARRILLLPIMVTYFRAQGIEVTRGWRIYGLPLIQRHRRSEIRIDDGFQMRNWLDSNPLGVGHRGILATRHAGATIQIGRDTGITGGTICAQETIEIGDRVRLGANCTVVDTDFHPLDVATRHAAPTAGRSAPVYIGDDVFVGMNSIILKGTRIGARSVVGAGSVVSGEVPPDVIVAGNPAKIIRTLSAQTRTEKSVNL